MGRKILFITTDQQRYDTLGCNQQHLARTPVIDAVAAGGIRYSTPILSPSCACPRAAR